MQWTHCFHIPDRQLQRFDSCSTSPKIKAMVKIHNTFEVFASIVKSLCSVEHRDPQTFKPRSHVKPFVHPFTLCGFLVYNGGVVHVVAQSLLFR